MWVLQTTLSFGVHIGIGAWDQFWGKWVDSVRGFLLGLIPLSSPSCRAGVGDWHLEGLWWGNTMYLLHTVSLYCLVCLSPCPDIHCGVSDLPGQWCCFCWLSAWGFPACEGRQQLFPYHSPWASAFVHLHITFPLPVPGSSHLLSSPIHVLLHSGLILFVYSSMWTVMNRAPMWWPWRPSPTWAPLWTCVWLIWRDKAKGR